MICLRRPKYATFCFYFFLGAFFHYLLGRIIANHDSKLIDPNLIKPQPTFAQYLVILSISSVGNFERREAIRQTWGTEIDADSKLYFVISGKNISPEHHTLIIQENLRFNDLLILNGVEDSFHTLTLKVLVAFLWLSGEKNTLGELGKASGSKPFHNFSYVLKCDDDSFVMGPRLVTELKTTLANNSMLYWGFFDGRAKVKKTGKYKELSWNICDTYLPYALGGGYVLAANPVLFIAKNAEYWQLYRNEDTSVGAWLSNLKGLYRHHDPRFDTEYLSRGCHQSYLVTHKHTVEAMRRIHNQIISKGFLCRKEYRTRLSYNYDWNVPPSKCCIRNNPAIP